MRCLDSGGEDGDLEMHEEEKEFLGLNDFIENEAELSGEDEGSGDEAEDARNDGWEAEAGDAEEYDEDEVRDQVGRAHLKTLLDEDRRDVRLMQELFLEDGELHSDSGVRQRQFRWRGVDETEELSRRMDEEREEGEEAVIGEEERESRRLRMEREKWLMEQSPKVDDEITPVAGKRPGVWRAPLAAKSAAPAKEPAGSPAKKAAPKMPVIYANLFTFFYFYT